MIFKLILSFLLFGASFSYADEPRRTVENVVTVDSLGAMYTTITVPTTSSVTTKSISLINSGIQTSVGVMYKATSTGVVGVSIQAFRSFQRPTTEGVADATWVVWNAPATTSDTAWHMATLDTVVVPYMTLKLTGTGSNDASTTVQIKVSKI